MAEQMKSATGVSGPVLAGLPSSAVIFLISYPVKASRMYSDGSLVLPP